ncbi:hypothetical protein SRHO_G00170650 [Serrasalmus rhombeus]
MCLVYGKLLRVETVELQRNITSFLRLSVAWINELFKASFCLWRFLAFTLQRYGRQQRLFRIGQRRVFSSGAVWLFIGATVSAASPTAATRGVICRASVIESRSGEWRIFPRDHAGAMRDPGPQMR